MSMEQAAAMLQRYNKKNRSRIATNADGTNDSPDVAYNKRPSPLGQFSYANIYDALYDELSVDQNFNINTWHQSFAKGEQDTYIAFLQQNKGMQMSEQYYNPIYYNYEAQMLELYKNFAQGGAEERTGPVWNDTKGWVEGFLGNLTEKEYIDYQLGLNYKSVDQELALIVEQDRKDRLGWWGQFGHDIAATLSELGEGVLSALTGIADFVAAPFYATGATIAGEDWLDAYVDYYGKGLTALEKENVRAALDEYERTHTHFRDLKTGEYTNVGKYVGGIANSIGMMVPSIVLNAVTAGLGGTLSSAAVNATSKVAAVAAKIGATAIKWIGMSSFYMAVYSGNLYENITNPLTKDSPSWLKVTNALVRSATEAVIEYALGKLLGGTLSNQLLGMAGGSSVKSIARGVTRAAGLRYLVKSAAQEGLEEFLQDFSTNLVNQFTGMVYEGYEDTGVTFQTLVDSFAIGALASIFMSGGNIAFKGAVSRITGKNLYIETDGKLDKLTGLRRYYFTSILSDFRRDVENLRLSKATSGNIELAQEVYATYSAMSSLYASFGAERVKNAEKLLSRVVKAEENEIAAVREREGLGTDSITDAEIRSIIGRKNLREITTQELRKYADTLAKDINDMVGGATGRFVIKKVKKFINENKEKFADGKVTQVRSAVNKKGEVHTKDPEMERVRQKLSGKYDKLASEYDWVFTTDGHVAIEGDGMIFVPQEWLEHYQVSDIYKFLSQEHILDGLLKDKSLQSFIKSITAYNASFTGRTGITQEQALMDFLFNESVYRSYLLSNKGKNMFKHKDVVFNILAYIDVLVSEKGLSKEKQNYYKQIKEQIRKNWQKPTILAIINWNMDPQSIGADYILSERDRTFIKQYQTRKEQTKNAVSANNVSAAYLEDAKTLIENGSFTDEEKALIREGLDAPANSRERLVAILLLNEADRRYTTYDFAARGALRDIENVQNLLSWFIANKNNTRIELTNFINKVRTLISAIERIAASQNTLDTYRAITDQMEHDIATLETRDISQFVDKYQQYFSDLRNMVQAVNRMITGDLAAMRPNIFVVPMQAMSEFGVISAEEVQAKADAIRAFVELYGTSPENIMYYNFVFMTEEQFNRLDADMTSAGYDINNRVDLINFTIGKLETLLGPEYVVTPEFDVPSTFVRYKSYHGYKYDLDVLADKLVKIRKRETLTEKELAEIGLTLSRFAMFLDDKSLDDFVAELPKNITNNFVRKNAKLIEAYWAEMQDANEERLRTQDYTVGGYVISKRLDAKTLLKPAYLDENTLKDLFRDMLYNGYVLTLGDFLNIAPQGPKSRNFLDNWHVVAEYNHRESYSGVTSLETRTIGINLAQADVVLDTLVHEINHAIQYAYKIARGFNPDAVLQMPAYMSYIAETYPEVVLYMLRRSYEGDAARDFAQLVRNTNRITSDDIYALDDITKNAISYIGYRIVQGELFAASKMHNPSSHGAYFVSESNNNVYLRTPDGKQDFIVPGTMTASTPYEIDNDVSEDVQARLLEITFQNTLDAYFEGPIDNENRRNTFHTGLTRKSRMELNSLVLNPDLPIVTRASVTLDQIIRDPQTYLKPELAEQTRNMTEGQVYYFLRDYVEQHEEGVSIDRDANTHEYKFVNDNAFDDLLTDELYAETENDESNSLVEKYKSENGVPLRKFYGEGLNELNIPGDIPVVINEKVRTQTIFSKEYPRGRIEINSRDLDNANFIDKLNHEFRHLLQRYNRLEGGFTADFVVTDEMLADIKKHAPQIFEIARDYYRQGQKQTVKEYERYVAQRFIYFLVGGEQNAFGMRANSLFAKPIYVTQEAGKPTIFMPWYNAKTGDGRYTTEFIANRAMDDEADITEKAKNKRKTGGITVPRKTRTLKYTSAEVDDLGSEHPKVTYKYKGTNRYFTKEDAENGGNLIYFYRKNKHNQMDPDLQQFVIATTGHEKELPKELVYAIQKGKLTKQALFKWFSTTDLRKMNQFTFDLVNKYMFKNTEITTPAELERISIRAQEWYAVSLVLKRDGLELDYLVKQNDINALVSFLEDMKNTKWNERINKAIDKFQKFSYDDGGKRVYVELDMEKVEPYMRTLAMNTFDGSLASAFYVAGAARKALLRQTLAEMKAQASLDASFSRGKGDDQEMTLADTNRIQKLEESVNEDVGNDITALYELTHDDVSLDEMIDELIQRASERYLEHYTKVAKEKRPDVKESALRKAINEQVRKKTVEYVSKLNKMSEENVKARYEKMREEQLTGTQSSVDYTDVDAKIKPPRVNIVANIKSFATQLLKLVNNGQVVWDNLPKEVQDMFQWDEITIRGVKQKVRSLKPEVYSVGRGAVKGERNFASNTELTHDVTKILENRNLLSRVLSDAKNNVFATKENAAAMSKAERELAKANREKMRELTKKTRKEITVDNGETEGLYKKEITVDKKKKSKTSDTPNNFTIVSAEPMPDVLKGIFDTSFADMADTRVQFASLDEEGNLYDKETMGEKFESRLKHEVNSWNAFYEANRHALLELTRTDVEQIVDFIEGGSATFDGPANKLMAFQIFMMGYIYDAARRNLNNWDFSDTEIDAFRALYEKLASAHGSGLNAVGQMIAVIDPFKKVRQRMLDDYNISDAELQPLLDAVDNLQNAKRENYEEYTTNVAKQLSIVERRMMVAKALEAYELASKRRKARIDRKYDIKALQHISENDLKNLTDKEFYSRLPALSGHSLYQRIKSLRYTFMLSSPMTWIRNYISNAVQFVFNGASDAISRIVFAKKEYRQDQWDLTHAKVSQEVKDFINTNIKNSELFDALYDNQTKYDDRKKNVERQKALFVTMIVSSLENRYAANHKFDHRTMNMIARFVNRMISDKRFIKFVTGRYLGKILQINLESGVIDLEHGLTNNILNLFADAVILANMDYMHKRSFLNDMLDSIREKHPGAYEVLNWWQPFMNSSFNWFAEMLKYTPLGLVRAIYNMTRLEQRITKADSDRAKGYTTPSGRVQEYLARRDIGKGILGTLLIATGMLLGAIGVLKIDEDDDKFYITVDDIKVDVSNIFASSSILVGAALVQLGRDNNDDGEADYAFEDVLGFIAEYFTEGFLLKDIIDRHRWDNGAYEAFLTETESILRSFVPQFVQLWVRALNNEEITYSGGFLGMLERWLNTFVPTQPFGTRKVNPYTGEISTKYAIPVIGELLKGGIFGPRIYWEEMSTMEEYARSLDVNKGQLTTKELDDDETGKKFPVDTYRLNKKYGELNSSALAKLSSQRHYVQMPDGTFKTLPWDKLSDEQKANVIDRTMRQNADLAKIWYWTQVLGKKYYASNSLYNALKAAGITRNVYRGDRGFVE